MKTKNNFLLLILLFLIILSGCDISVTQTFGKEKRTDGKALVYISLRDMYSRTAMPVFDWNDFTYELVAVQNPGEASQKDPEVLFSNRSYDQLVQGIPLDPANYKFTLNAYNDSQKVFSGNQTIDLSSGDKSLSFLMYTVSGGKGSASVKIRYPKDSIVSKIYAYVSEDIFEEKEGDEIVSRIVSGRMEAVYETENLDSNKEQYAIIKFYDSNNALIYSCAESLIVAGGCVSKSVIELTDDDWHAYTCTITLKKDDAGWVSSGKSVSLVNKTNSSKVYQLKDSAGGKFISSVAEGTYYIFVNDENTGIEFNSVNKNADVNYYTIYMTPVKNSTMVPVSGGIDVKDNSAVVQAEKSFTYQIKLSNGYEVLSGFVLTQNEQVVDGASFNTDIIIDSVNETTVIRAEGITPKEYTISYSDNGGGFATSQTDGQAYWYKFEDTYTPPVTFTAEEVVVLPAIENIRKDDKFFDAWTDTHGNIIIDTEGVFENLVLSANWKDAPRSDDINKVIYANGFNLIIKGTDAKNTATSIYIDYNGDGLVNDDDYQITCTNITTSKSNDFTDYELRAGSSDGSYVPKSDFVFTMTGGKISAIYGLNSQTQKYSNKSTLRISGTAQIGNIENQATVINPDSTTTTTAHSVKGIMLDTLSSERVFIVGQMTNLSDTAKTPYEVTCVSTKNYDRNEEHVVAEIANSKYASLANFTCWNVAADENDSSKKNYTQIILTNKEVLFNSVEKTYINMADNSGVVLPAEDELMWEDDEFRFDAETVNKPCSVFSLAIENGTFRVNERTTITNKKTDSEQTVESTLTYMAQPTPLTYVEELKFEENYVYMQVFSSGDLLTPLIINDFISQVYFKKNNDEEKIKITLNIETVPSAFIRGEGDGSGGAEFKYFNGSFYKRYYYENDEDKTDYNGVTQTSGSNSGKKLQLIKWTNSYNKAKQKSFNGLKGYLMNITSEVENNYIYDTYFKLQPNQLSWAGGATFVPVAKTTGIINGEEIPWWDQDVTANSSNKTTPGARTSSPKWYWQAGPEAGMCFWSVAAANTGKIDGVFERWNNATLHSDVYTSDIDSTDPQYLIRGSAGAEPNGVSGDTTSEPCLQFLAGRLTPSGKDYYANGFWNNQGDLNNQSSGYGCTGYFVEFTPYETEYGKQVANYQAIKRTAEY